MKIHSFLAAFCFCSLAHAQIFSSVSLEDVPGSQKSDCKLVGVSTDGQTLLTTTVTNRGLWQRNASTGESVLISDAPGAGFQPVLSDDGKNVMFRKVRFDQSHRRLTSLYLQTLGASGEECLVSPTRELQGYRFKENTALAVADSKPVSKRIAGRKIGNDVPVVSLQDLQLTVTCNGKTTQLSPNGTDVTYIWPSLSPDGTHILYYVGEEGVYVCNLEGTDVQFISHDCRAPQWYDNHTIVGMKDTDNGQYVTSSCLIAYTLDGKHQQLTEPSTLTMYPQCCPTKSCIYCCTYEGELKIVNVKKEE